MTHSQAVAKLLELLNDAINMRQITKDKRGEGSTQFNYWDGKVVAFQSALEILNSIPRRR